MHQSHQHKATSDISVIPESHRVSRYWDQWTSFDVLLRVVSESFFRIILIDMSII